ncbi:adenylate/guanylate cyclase domain-containing protein [Candidatus Parabeggiatoa sp. HSG14]|uniref:adenylate/guanylate cyclase domain-containing protein n=1 Tax=Candidatus Parabeggiatoa sp. HSG14 TaxID=3055593 RepID=UPI0025A90831|nr:adenylate/guanylate cyclase domain-containing protein [Thiotrichales bacterium HSG14]
MINTAKILIVDDIEVNREILHDLIVYLGHTPILAENGHSALNKTRQQHPDIILLDIIMPEMDGYAVLEQLKNDETLRHIPVIVVSAIDDMDSVIQCIKNGADDYLVKPFNRVLLKARIEAGLEKKYQRDAEKKYRQQIEEYNQNLEKRVHEQVQKIVASHKARTNLSRYLSPNIVDKVLASKQEIQLGGEKSKVTILFADIRGYTKMSQQMNVNEIVDMLNEHFTEMANIIFQQGGTLDKFIGDSVMAVFGSPFSFENDEYNAIMAAQAMQRAMLKRNAIRKQRNQIPYQIGIGINTGEVITGNIGSPQKMDYTVIGDTVNLAARLQGIAKGGEIMVGEETYRLVKDKLKFTLCGEVSLKNIFYPVKCYYV